MKERLDDSDFWAPGNKQWSRREEFTMLWLSEQSLIRSNLWFKLLKTRYFPCPLSLCFLLASFILAKLSYSSPVCSANLFTIMFEMVRDHHHKQIQNSTSYRLRSLPPYTGGASLTKGGERLKNRLGISYVFRSTEPTTHNTGQCGHSWRKRYSVLMILSSHLPERKNQEETSGVYLNWAYILHFNSWPWWKSFLGDSKEGWIYKVSSWQFSSPQIKWFRSVQRT